MVPYTYIHIYIIYTVYIYFSYGATHHDDTSLRFSPFPLCFLFSLTTYGSLQLAVIYRYFKISPSMLSRLVQLNIIIYDMCVYIYI